MAGFYYVAQLLRAEDRDRDFLYVGLGRSPVVIMEFLRQVFDIDARDLPLSIETTKVEYSKGKRDVPYDEAMATFIDHYLPRDLLRGRKVILVDYVDSGYSLLSAQGLMEAHLKALGLYEEAEHVYIAPLTNLEKFLKDEKSVLGQFRPDISAAHRLLKVLHATIDKEPFSRFPRTSEKSIREGRFPQPDVQAVSRLQNVMRLALQNLGEDREQIMETLRSSKFLKTKRRPERTFQQSIQSIPPRGQLGRSVVVKDHLNERYSSLSAKEYGIPNGRLSYEFQRGMAKARRHPYAATGVGVTFAILAIFFIYMLVKALMALEPVDHSDRIQEL
ncbi:hypothetical protein D7V97_12560 [Corallococcus sp. CA053C]|uniref:hypothetical protein n=1 Tax=Corallococcus sp. CA053C TaxID=2316732 RepID=UPI000EA29426|nr:hypothetical protein [Corallococcus sp. CA053C]RKH10959.1 hypothetical protein D7V97_12560 [Corallococcus sp. CA053C]